MSCTSGPGSRDAPHSANASPEGHYLQLGENGELIAMTIVNARWFDEREGKIVVKASSSTPISTAVARWIASNVRNAESISSACRSTSSSSSINRGRRRKAHEREARRAHGQPAIFECVGHADDSSEDV